jgi:hypothetical protein
VIFFSKGASDWWRPYSKFLVEAREYALIIQGLGQGKKEKNHLLAMEACGKTGGDDWIRTNDQGLMSPLLYH